MGRRGQGPRRRLCSPRDYDVVARFGGGDNAGHSIVVGDRKLALRIVPRARSVPRAELLHRRRHRRQPRGAARRNSTGSPASASTSRAIKISDRAHVVFPYHAALDRAERAARAAAPRSARPGAASVRPTSTGSARIGHHVRRSAPAAKRSPTRFATTCSRGAALRRDRRPCRAKKTSIARDARALAERVLPHVVDGVAYIHEALERGKHILAEGAQGTLLDVDVRHVSVRHELAHDRGRRVHGPGHRPDARSAGDRRREGVLHARRRGPVSLRTARRDAARACASAGGEFGTVTGRPRRCGWFDAVAARYAVRVNGLRAPSITKLDVLSGFEKLAIVTGYRVAGDAVGFEAAGEPDLELEMRMVRRLERGPPADAPDRRLAAAARRYVTGLERALSVPIDAVSLGPERASLAVL